TQRPASPDALEKPHPKAKSSMSPRPHLNFSKFKQPRLVNNPGKYTTFLGLFLYQIKQANL
ncbi:MAG: hypothetical protein J7L72_04990, partial [Candidatus Aminicenantes bacterium]|nr:hypothetical protein [Candidatus Aminicenantes bacterium]